MASADIMVVGPAEIPVICDLYNQVFVPPREEELFHRRCRGRYNVLFLIAQIDGRPAGFATGFEQKPNVYCGWLCGVLKDYRRQGVASQLIEAQHAWARDHHYTTIRFECLNKHRAMLHLAIEMGYDLVGVRWEPDLADNLVIFEKNLVD